MTDADALAEALPRQFADARQALERTASAWTGLGDFGPDDYHQPLDVLLDALARSDAIVDSGRRNSLLFLLMQLIGRLHSQQGWKDRPDCLGHDVSDPLIITGLVRSGTTALHHLIANDPQFQVLEHWLSRIPMPRPPREQWPAIREFKICAGMLDDQVKDQPIFRTARMIGDPCAVEESQSLTCQSFVSITFGYHWSVPAYDAYFWHSDQTASYARFADNLRLIGSNEADKQWLLKNPGDSLAIEAVLHTFANARFIHTYRAPARAILSMCNMLVGVRRFFEGGHSDLALMGQRVCYEWHLAMSRLLEARRRQPHRFLDISFDAFHAEPLDTVRRIYSWLGKPLPQPVQARMQLWIDSNRYSGSTPHRHSLQEFGLSEAAIRAKFADYIATFNL